MEQLGDYTIQKRLGEGPFGSVYLAEHRFIKRPFALKVLPQEISLDPMFMRRVDGEVARIAALDHPHIAKIHNISSADGYFFLVTDPIVDSFNETVNLDRYLELKGRSLVEEDWHSLALQVASALDYAHAAGVTHGGLRLSNILVAPTDQGVKLFLSDFGIASLIGEKWMLTRLCEQIARQFPSRAFMQAYAFLAPEQKSLDAEVTEKVDAYAFGVLAYYLLFRKVPEGCFELPSKAIAAAAQNWDFLINRCLQPHPNLRPQVLSQAMHEYLRAPRAILKEMLHLSEVEPKVENTLQMAFELEPVLKPQEIARPDYETDPAAIFQQGMQVSHYTPSAVETQDIEPLLTEMVVIPGGAYKRGSHDGARDEMPRHEIRLPSFAMDIHPVTNEQFVRFLQAMRGEKDHNNNDIIRLRDSRIKRATGKLTIEAGYGKHPVVGVTWYGAVAYAKWVGKRLPTEAEWEIASLGGREILYPSGPDIDRTQANFFSSDTTPVASYATNGYGLFDMAGNVYEWCQDWYAYNAYEASSIEPDHPLGPPQGVYRVLRGGCWKSLKEDLRCSHRHRNNPGAVNSTYGFRCAADVA